MSRNNDNIEKDNIVKNDENDNTQKDEKKRRKS